MAITHSETQVTWDTGSNSTTLATVTGENSDNMSVDDTCVAAQVELKADHTDTAAAGSGDTCDFYIGYSLGDPDGASTAEYASTNHLQYLATLDMDADETAVMVVPINPVCANFFIRAYNNAGETITVSATVLEQRAA